MGDQNRRPHFKNHPNQSQNSNRGRGGPHTNQGQNYREQGGPQQNPNQGQNFRGHGGPNPNQGQNFRGRGGPSPNQGQNFRGHGGPNPNQGQNFRGHGGPNPNHGQNYGGQGGSYQHQGNNQSGNRGHSGPHPNRGQNNRGHGGPQPNRDINDGAHGGFHQRRGHDEYNRNQSQSNRGGHSGFSSKIKKDKDHCGPQQNQGKNIGGHQDPQSNRGNSRGGYQQNERKQDTYYQTRPVFATGPSVKPKQKPSQGNNVQNSANFQGSTQTATHPNYKQGQEYQNVAYFRQVEYKIKQAVSFFSKPGILGNAPQYGDQQKYVQNPGYKQKDYVFEDTNDWVVVQENKKPQQQNKQRTNKKPTWRAKQRWKRRKQSTNSEPSLISFERSVSQVKLNEEEMNSSSDDGDSDTVSVAGSAISSFSSHKPTVSDVDDDIVTEAKPTSTTSSFHSEAKGIIGVFWDIENCSIPKGKSPREIIKKIRSVFYGGRTEYGFTVACDVQKLGTKVSKEITSAHVDLMHIDSGQKNAADDKMKDCLERFGEVERPEGSCVILISGDVDFGYMLHNLRYRKKIYVVLIHNQNAKIELVDTANEAILFDEFVRDISSLNEPKLEYLLIENIPPKFAGRAFTTLRHLVPNLKGKLETKIQFGCCMISFLNKDDACKALAYFNSKKVGIFENPYCQITPSSGMKEWNALQDSFNQSTEKSEALSDQKTSAEDEQKCLKGKAKGNRTNKKFDASEDQKTSAEEDQKCSPVEAKQKRPKKKSSDNQIATSDKEQNSMPDKKQKCLPVETFLLLESEVVHGADFWKSFLSNIVKDATFKDVTVQDTKIRVTFESINAAKRMMKLLQNDQLTEIKVLGIQKESDMEKQVENLKKQKAVASMISNCKSTLDKKCALLLKEHDKKKKEVETEIATLQNIINNLPSTTKPSEYDSLSVSIKATESKLAELTKQENVFKSFCSRNISVLDKYIDIELPVEECFNLTGIIKKELGQECHLFSQALPIYAQKAEVISMVRKNSVNIILAETGSGKSTQIVQFLYQAGISEKGKIVCTQPRKLAARSLATYVSNQLGSSLGKLVGFKVGLQAKLSEETRIMYMTDHCLLNECLVDSSLSKYSCVIVDEVHERSIFTDILLGMLKNIVKQRPSFKLVLTSATINPAVFQKYFDVQNDAILNVSGRIFPIEVVWSQNTVSSNYDFLNQSVMKAFDIHVSEEQGHILVFLPTPADTLKACDMLNQLVQKKNFLFDALCLPLHGRLSSEEQFKIFSVVSPKTRKIIFATNCAETSITVPGICYVVDTGMAKELHYDAKTRSNILKLGMITRSSAEQRKGRAGRTQAGKCYRLFSKENYENMAEDMKPEIMRVNLGQALLKLMELGIENPCDFDFVESPPPSSFLSAMQNLICLGAVKDGKLTEIGSKMAKLSLEPALSKLVIRGFEENIGYEAIVMATLATMSGTIFFRLEENKEIADLKKTEFCQEEGDFHTFLEVYKNYILVPKQNKSQWCGTNFINGKAMKITSDGVRDLQQTCEQEFGIPVSNAYSSRPDVKEILQYLILEVFSLNLCIFSGHRSLGYIPMKGTERVYLHPSSCLSYLGRMTPQFVVYQTKLLTVKDYITGITPVSEACLAKAVENGLYQNETLEKLKESALINLTFGPHGVGILREFCGAEGRRRHELEQHIVKETNDKAIWIDTDFTSGLVTVYCKNEFSTVVTGAVTGVLENIIQRLKIQSEVITLDGNLESIRYVLNSGAVISDAVMPDEFVAFTVHDMEPTFELEKLVKLCDDSKHAYIYREIMRRQKPEYLVTFKEVKPAMSTAQKAREVLPCKVKPHVISNNKNSSREVPFFQLFVTWNRRPLKGFGYMSFQSVDDYYQHSPQLTSYNQRLNVPEGPFHIVTNKKKAEELSLKNIPTETTLKDVENAIRNIIGQDVKFTLKLIREPEFETTDEDLEAMKNTLKKLFSSYTRVEDIDVYVFKPKNSHGFWRAKVSFHNAKDGQIAYNAMRGYQTYPGTTHKLNMSVEINSSIVCHEDIFEIAKVYIDEALVALKTSNTSGDSLQIKAHPSKGISNFVVVSIQSNNIGDMERAQKVLQEIIRGDRIECLGFPLREKLFLPAGKAELKKIERNSGSKIHLDFGKKTISIIGSVTSQTQTKLYIHAYLDLIDGQSSREIHLRYPKKPQGFLKLILQEYGIDFAVLKDGCNLHSVELNIQRHVLTIFGSSESVQNAEDSLNELSNRISSEASSEEEECCPICLSSVPSDGNFYRLQTCGHPYCIECIIMQIQDCTVPLVCAAQDCGEHFVMNDLKQLLDEKMKSSVAQGALKHLVQTRNKEFRYCPTPECPAVYKVTSDTSKNSKIFCDKCTNYICIRCNVQFHQGYDCDAYRNIKEDEDYYLKEWMRANPSNRKMCPKCGVNIEKNGGCMHMTCWSCKAHMCWRCMKVFPGAGQVYDHQAYCTAP